MTKLRDDEYLETDDPVVAACFLGQKARQQRSDVPSLFGVTGILCGIYDRPDVPFDIYQAEDNAEYEATHILIEAETVADVFGYEPATGQWPGFTEGEINKRFWLPMQEMGILHYELAEWLDTHTKESKVR